LSTLTLIMLTWTLLNVIVGHFRCSACVENIRSFSVCFCHISLRNAHACNQMNNSHPSRVPLHSIPSSYNSIHVQKSDRILAVRQLSTKCQIVNKFEINSYSNFSLLTLFKSTKDIYYTIFAKFDVN